MPNSDRFTAFHSSNINSEKMLETIQQIPIEHYVLYSSVLFIIGIFGVLTRRNAIVVLMCVELMLNAVNLLLAAFSTYLSDAQGQIMVFFIMVVAAAEAAVGLGILVMIYRNTKSTDISLLDKLKN
jgi:NADH-quinone oxidoreductase subunit K